MTSSFFSLLGPHFSSVTGENAATLADDLPDYDEQHASITAFEVGHFSFKTDLSATTIKAKLAEAKQQLSLAKVKHHHLNHTVGTNHEK